MDVTSASQPSFEAGALQRGATTSDNSLEKATGGFSTDFETFLKMLTTQLRNQDPLNPIESSDFAVQLATFSTVEQQVLTNDLLTDLGARIGAQGLSQVSGWIGMEALSELPVTFSGEPVSLLATVDPQAEAAEIVATNAQGIIVNRQPIPTTSGQVLWAGLDPIGLPLAHGDYALSVHSLVNDDIIARHNARVPSRIVEAQFEAGEAVLLLESGQRISPDQVLGLRPSSQ
ncbi:flagellar hook capping FlgD N-terminal domain-containing protein [Roseovarius sp. 217]|uniref:flagellar hook capping FlgD N-terminal domain-containing protein n=1 Tax=Roseovarius sp. (strain 217) TaxID=314264 RepID=UPI0000687DF9|nr:flagellar hook capping FlgD N-terminal domain-containing protein [Roseovarius sp. 217]EAQ24238.1 Possible FlgD protein [Roseovarius sp. 217]